MWKAGDQKLFQHNLGKCQFWGNNLEMRKKRKTCEEASSGQEMIIILQLLAHTGPSLVVAENIPFTIIYLRNL